MNLSGLISKLKRNKNVIKTLVVNSLGIFLGSLIYALGVNIFIQPNHIVPGGFIGIAIILNHFSPIFKIGITIIILNIPLFLIGGKRLGRAFLASSIVGTFLSSILIDLTLPFIPELKTDPILAAIYGGFLMGAGIGIIFRFYGSTGGTDLLAQIVYDFTGLPFGQFLMLIDTVIIILSGIVFKSVNVPLYSIIAEFVSNYAIDIAQEGFTFYKTLLVITEHPDKIEALILSDLERGITKMKAKGAYTGQDKTVLLVAIPHTEVSKAKKLILSIDPSSFIIVGTASEIIGQGFKSAGERI
jgi:uncharacterized membrane-anchored protein YitT (DUF2179 family)